MKIVRLMMSQRVRIPLPGGDDTCSLMFVHSSKTNSFFCSIENTPKLKQSLSFNRNSRKRKKHFYAGGCKQRAKKPFTGY